MALLQIAEPGAATAPHQHKLAIGIDLGTTHSLVAAVRSGVAETLPDAQGRHLLPSVVRYLAGGCVVGDDAKNNAVSLIESVEKLMKFGTLLHVGKQKSTKQRIRRRITKPNGASLRY